MGSGIINEDRGPLFSTRDRCGLLQWPMRSLDEIIVFGVGMSVKQTRRWECEDRGYFFLTRDDRRNFFQRIYYLYEA